MELTISPIQSLKIRFTVTLAVCTNFAYLFAYFFVDFVKHFKTLTIENAVVLATRAGRVQFNATKRARFSTDGPDVVKSTAKVVVDDHTTSDEQRSSEVAVVCCWSG